MATRRPASSKGRTADTSTRSRRRRAQRTADVVARMRAALEAGDVATRHELVDELVVANLEVAHWIAYRYRGRGLGMDDLDQVARLGLVKAARGFDPLRQVDFLTYAVPTIRGEVLKHFRDFGWMVRPPRHIQELQTRIASIAGELAQELGRSPRPTEVAARLGVDPAQVQAALSAEGCFAPASLDRLAHAHDGTTTLGDLLPDDDHGQEAAEARMTLAPAVRHLNERDRRILQLRYFKGMTQEEIAQEIGVTQMHVSRLLVKILVDLREQLATR